MLSIFCLTLQPMDLKRQRGKELYLDEKNLLTRQIVKKEKRRNKLNWTCARKQTKMVRVLQRWDWEKFTNDARIKD